MPEGVLIRDIKQKLSHLLSYKDSACIGTEKNHKKDGKICNSISTDICRTHVMSHIERMPCMDIFSHSKSGRKLW